MAALRALIAALFIPAIGAGLAFYILHSMAAYTGASLDDVMSACAPSTLVLTLSPECAPVQPHYWLILASAVTAVVGVALIIAFIVASLVTGGNRVLLSIVFPTLSFVGLMLVGALVTAQIAILAAGMYLAEAYFFNQVHTVIILVIAGAGALFGLSIVWRTLGMFRHSVSGVVGVPLSAIEQPRLALLVQQIARSSGARPPDNIVLGLDANFFATNAHIHTPTSKRLLTGQTLYLSLPLMRVLSLEEMKAVVGHELAHFSGSDTAYSRHFAPIYRGFAEAGQVADDHKQYDRNILLLPARLFLRFMTECFSHNAARASRARELRADALGAKASTPIDLGYALIDQ